MSIQKDRKDIDKAEKGEEVCIKIEPLDKGLKYEYDVDFNSDWILQTKYSEEDKEKILKYFIF